MRLGWHSIGGNDAPGLVAGSGWAPPRDATPPRGAPAVVTPADLDECFIRSLHDALAADVDPRSGGHLPEHHQPKSVELVEVIERRPVRHQVRVRDQHARRIGMGAENSDRFARLNQQRLVALELTQRGYDPIEAVPVAGGTADSAVDDKLARPLGDIRIEIFHQHAERGFRQPALGADLGPARSPDRAVVVQSAVHEKGPFSASSGNGLLLSTEIAAVGNAPASTSAVAFARS